MQKELSSPILYSWKVKSNPRSREFFDIIRMHFPPDYESINLNTVLYPHFGSHIELILGKFLPPGFYTTGPCWISKRCDSGIIIKPERVFDSCFSFPLIFFLPSINIISKNPLHAS